MKENEIGGKKNVWKKNKLKQWKDRRETRKKNENEKRTGKIGKNHEK